MSPESIARAVWFGELFQFLAAIILTPEIIGPDRFDRLERYIESLDFSKQRDIRFRTISFIATGLASAFLLLFLSSDLADVLGFRDHPIAIKLYRWIRVLAAVIFILSVVGALRVLRPVVCVMTWCADDGG